MNHEVSRRSFFGGMAAALGFLGIGKEIDLFAQGQARMKKTILDTRKKTTADLQAFGYDVLPSEANFFMVGIGRPVQPVIEEFKKKNILVGRPFPPMTEHLRVSVGTPDDMNTFLTAFKEIFPAKPKATTAVL